MNPVAFCILEIPAYPLLPPSASEVDWVALGPSWLRDWVYWVKGATKQSWYRPGFMLEVRRAALPGLRGTRGEGISEELAMLVKNRAFSNCDWESREGGGVGEREEGTERGRGWGRQMVEMSMDSDFFKS